MYKYYQGSRKLLICQNCDELQYHYNKSPYCKECNKENKKYFDIRKTLKIIKLTKYKNAQNGTKK